MKLPQKFSCSQSDIIDVQEEGMNNNNNRNLLLKLSIIRKVLEKRGLSKETQMAWRATGANNEQFIDELRGKN